MPGLRLNLRPVGGKAFRHPPYFRTKHLAIIGCTLSRQFAPWHDPRWTIASHTSARQFCEREPDWYFDLHRPECFRVPHKSWNPDFHTWLKTLQTPIFMQKAWPEIPMAVEFPLDRILAEFRAYFTNHVSYMIALAMTEGVERIGIFGCEYGHKDSEYVRQRGSLEYWLGRFEQAGGTVVMPKKHCSVLNFPSTLYGYASHDDLGRLTGDYKVQPAVEKPNEPPRPLTVIDMDRPDGRIPLMPPPDGAAIAWARSGHTIHQ